jgi:hypothetical protein
MYKCGAVRPLLMQKVGRVVQSDPGNLNPDDDVLTAIIGIVGRPSISQQPIAI